MADLTIVVPTEGSSGPLDRLLLSIVGALRGAALRVNLLVVYKAKKPEIGDIPICFKVKFIQAVKEGVNHKRNLGLLCSESPVTLFLDDDCEIEDSSFFQKHISKHKDDQVQVVGGSYINKAHGFWSRRYAGVQNQWQQVCFKNNDPAFLGGNLSLKTHSGSKWIRFNEEINFGGSETDLIAKINEIQPQMLSYDKEIILKHHITIGFFSFIKKAFLQGRSAGVLSSEVSVEPMKDVEPSVSSTYDLFFNAGKTYGYCYGYSRPSFLEMFFLMLYQLIGWPRFGKNLKEESRSKNLNHQPLFKGLYFYILYKAMYPIFYRIFYPIIYKFKQIYSFTYWKVMYPTFPVMKQLYWKAIFPVFSFFRWLFVSIIYWKLRWLLVSIVYWKVFFPIISFFKWLVVSIIYWKLIFPILSFFRWIFVSIVYWRVLFPALTFVRWCFVSVLYWKGIFPMVSFLKKMVADYLYWKGLFKVVEFIKSNWWQISRVKWICYKVYGRYFLPMLNVLLKPYYFLSYQMQKLSKKKISQLRN